MALRRRLLILVSVATMLPTAAASAHSVAPTIKPPASPPVEDSGFPIVFTGDTTGLSHDGNTLIANIRRAGGTPCPPTPSSDTGDRVVNSDFSKGPFSIAGTYVAPSAGDYLICAWIEDGIFDDYGPPASATMTVRPAALLVTATAPANVRTGTPFAVGVNYQAEVARDLTVVVVAAPNCSVSSKALRSISTSTFDVADRQNVSGVGALTPGAVRIDKAGTYLVCAFLEEDSAPEGAVAQYVVQAATIVVSSPPVMVHSCGNVGGRRHIKNVRARGLTCVRAKSLARQWGNRRHAPRQLGLYRCFTRSRNVTCTAGIKQVKFRFGRF
jgi:hypothetical protein